MLTLIKVYAILTIVSLIVSGFSYSFSQFFNDSKIINDIFISVLLILCLAIAKIWSL
jgi:hypothetical protein